MGRILALDFGTKRVGAAVSDPRRLIATPLEVYERRDAQQDARHYQALVRENEVDRLVIGLPVHLGGREGASAKLARNWGGWLSKVTGLEVVYVDERYSTFEAEASLIDVGFTVPAHSWTYWHLGPGVGPDYLNTEQGHDWSHRTGRNAARNLLAAARALGANPLPPQEEKPS